MTKATAASQEPDHDRQGQELEIFHGVAKASHLFAGPRFHSANHHGKNG